MNEEVQKLTMKDFMLIWWIAGSRRTEWRCKDGDRFYTSEIRKSSESRASEKWPAKPPTGPNYSYQTVINNL